MRRLEGENVRRCWGGGKVGRWESMKVKSWGGGGRVRNGVGEEEFGGAKVRR